MEKGEAGGRGAPAHLRVRREAFELCLLPLAPLLPRLETPAALQSFQRRLLAHSVPSSSPPERRLVSTSALADSLGVSEAAAASLVDVLACAAPDPHASASDSADVHHTLLLLFINTFARPHAQSALRIAGDAWPEESKGSPRRTHHAGSGGLEDEALLHAYVLRHLATLLPLLRSTPAAGVVGVDVQLSAAEFDRIGFLFSVVDRRHSTRLSDVAPAFAGGVQKSISLATAREWLTRACSPPPPPGAPPRRGDYLLEGASRATLLLREGDVAADGCLRLVDCREATLYLLAPCALVSLANCSDCTLVLGAVSRALRMENCARCAVTVAARCVQLRGCVGGVLHAAVARPTLALGDTRGMALAPFCTYYDALGRHLAAAGLGGATLAGGSAWAAVRSLGPPPSLPLLPPEELLQLVVPFSASAQGGEPEPSPTLSNPFPLPPAYAAALEAKTARVAAVQAAVQEAQLDDMKRQELQGAIQSHFRNWLVKTGHLRGVGELSRMAHS